MKHSLAFLLALFIYRATYAQIVEGTVADSKNGQPLAYVNVGIIGKSTGTVTDDQGRYKIDLKGSTSDTVKISMIGYQPKIILSAVFASGYQGKMIQLEPDNIKLKEVTIKPKNWKTAILGNTTKSKSSNSGFSSGLLGA